MRLLALDLATSTGWAFADGKGKPTHGVYRIPKTDDDFGEFGCDFRGWLDRTLVELKPDIVAYESPILRNMFKFDPIKKIKIEIPPNIRTLRKLYSLPTLAEMGASDRGIDKDHRFEVHMQTARAHFFSPAKTPKKSDAIAKAVMEKCRTRGWAPKSDDDADALVILEYARACHVPGWSLNNGLALFEGTNA